jgi:hypothetical protein
MQSFHNETLGFFSLLSSALAGVASCCRDSGEHINLVQLWLEQKIWLIEYDG